VVVDSRSTQAWDQGHVPGAVHLPTAGIPQFAVELLDRDVPVVVYCWGPGCNGAAARRSPSLPEPSRIQYPCRRSISDR